ncbi:MAG: glutamine-hydrolyzing carbamoyl-phosphate synthase small subunit [Gammaproteobacteria bacterium]|nr:glutamine-hydrolyzing carbamoyl-phosphate synthase small subunit [Gammaproteobacteria bacterium]
MSVGAHGSSAGELVFNTGMTGYQEILTDASYAHQLVMLTTAHVGNTGCNQDDMESSRVWAHGLILQNDISIASNYRSELSLPDFLRKHRVVAIAGIDTRALTHYLRDKGAISACITTDIDNIEHAIERAKAYPGLSGVDLARVVSRKTIERWHAGRGAWASDSEPERLHVVVYDFGVKHSILRRLRDKGCYLTLVPAETSAEDVIAMNPHGVLLSNGPGDPAACDYAIKATRDLLKQNIPVFGICLGFQILALACGAQAIKMKFGHHGSNHPVFQIKEPHRVLITSQNHGFAIDEASLPECLHVTHRSLFDKSLQGIIHESRPAFGFQGHPEAGPGPHDAACIFDQFIQLMHD